MIPHNSYHLLYIQTLQHSEHKTKCCFSTYDMVLPFPIKKVLIYYFEQHNQSYLQRLKLAKRLLAINIITLMILHAISKYLTEVIC